MENVLVARRHFRAHLPQHLRDAIAFFEADAYNGPSSIQDNVIFGKIAYGQAQAGARITELLTDILDDLGLRDRVIQVGLDAPCGVGGSRLSPAQRQKLAIAREVLKRPEIMILYDAVGALDLVEQARVRDSLLKEYQGRTLIWAVQQEDWACHFDHVLIMQERRVVAVSPSASSHEQPAEARELEPAS
jgi:ABC-type multidrug transport system fused ATPase/permease subunit